MSHPVPFFAQPGQCKDAYTQMRAVLDVLMKGFVPTILIPKVVSSGGAMGGGGAMTPPSKIQKPFLPSSIWANLVYILGANNS
jgi:hypothetical protein